MKKKHRAKLCGKCLKGNVSGSKICVHCGWSFKRGQISQWISKIKRYLAAVGEKKIG